MISGFPMKPPNSGDPIDIPDGIITKTGLYRYTQKSTDPFTRVNLGFSSGSGSYVSGNWWYENNPDIKHPFSSTNSPVHIGRYVVIIEIIELTGTLYVFDYG